MAEDRASICSYCGCGCRLLFRVEEGKVLRVMPDRTDPASRGSPCVKGLTIHEVADRGRVLHPMVRDAKEAPLREVSWEEAYERIYDATHRLSPDEVFLNASGKVTNEDAYITGKFARVALETSNIDACCARLCHIASVEAMRDCFGTGATPHTMDDVRSCDVILIVGSNPASNYPVLFHRLIEAKKKGTRIVSVQTVISTTSQFSDPALLIRPATEIVLLNGLMRRLIASGRVGEDVHGFEGFDELKRTVSRYDESFVTRICNISRESFDRFVDPVESAERLGLIHGMGMTQHIQAVEGVHALLDLMILKDAKLLSSRGEINVQGAGDMGCLPDALPTGPLSTLPALEDAWGVPVPAGRGRTIVEAFLLSPPKAAVISGVNPAQSLPNLDVVHENLRNMFLVTMESHHTLTMDFADVVLPTPTLWERRGTVTTGERRVRLVSPVRPPPGAAKPEWVVFKELAPYFGAEAQFPYRREIEITREIVSVVPAYRRVNVDSVYRGEDAWADKSIRFRRFVPEEFGGIVSLTSRRYPILLTSFRSSHQFLTGEMTRESQTLARFPDGPFCYVSAEDARRFRLENGQPVRVESAVTALDCIARVSEKIPKGVAGMHFHFKELLMNRLFPTQFDARTHTPNYKVVAVRISGKV
ncbi:MAG TPA: molybdopterin-dependent oxidoreductase [Thermoplasmata archaeon]